MTESLRTHYRTRFVLPIVAVVIWAFLGYRLERLSTSFTPPVDDVSFNWHPDLFRMITFGHAPAAVDWLMIRFLGTDTIEHVKPGTRAKVFYYLDLATDLDPAFFRLYTTGPTFLAVVRNDTDGAVILAEKGDRYRREVLPSQPSKMHEVWDMPWRVPAIKGYLYLFEKQDLNLAAAAYRELDGLPNVPTVMQKLATRFSSTAGIYEVGMRILSTMIEQSKEDIRLRDELVKKRNSLFLSQYLFQLNESFEKFLAKQPRYHARLKVSRAELQRHWREFSMLHRVPARDEWGGHFFLNEDGRVDSTTPRIEVMGMK